jgi:hypothetical protein
MRWIGALLLSLWLHAAASAAVVVSAHSSMVGDSSISSGVCAATTPLTVAVGDTFLLFGVEEDTSTPGTVSAHWDTAGTNQAMTLIGSVQTNSAGATPMSVALFGLVNPTSGAKNFSATFSSGGTTACYLLGVSFTGTSTVSVAAATLGFNAQNIATSATATNTTSASIPSGDLAVAWWSDLNGAGTLDGTSLGSNTVQTTNAFASWYSGAGSTVTSTFTNPGASDQIVAAIVGIAAPATASCPPPSLALLGVGC